MKKFMDNMTTGMRNNIIEEFDRACANRREVRVKLQELVVLLKEQEANPNITMADVNNSQAVLRGVALYVRVTNM